MIRSAPLGSPLTLRRAREIVDELGEDRVMGGFCLPDELHVSPEDFRELVASLAQSAGVSEPSYLRRVQVGGVPFVKQEAVRPGHYLKHWRD